MNAKVNNEQQQTKFSVYLHILQYDISIFYLAGCCYTSWQSSDEAVMKEGRMLRAYGSVQVNSFVFERTFSFRSPFPYSLTNSRITAQGLSQAAPLRQSRTAIEIVP